MVNEIKLYEDTELISVMNSQGIGEILKPLVKEILLFDTYVAGTAFLKDQSALSELSVGEKLCLQRESTPLDDNASAVLSGNRKGIGYIPEKDDTVFARLMDAGKMLTASISAIDRKGGFTKVSIQICMMDF